MGTCGHNCKSCNFSAGSTSSNCLVCDSSYGLSKSSHLNSVHTCSSCPNNCTKCSDADCCDQCAPGFAHTRWGCEACPDGCSNCTTGDRQGGPCERRSRWSSPVGNKNGGRQSCNSDGCRDGYGYQNGLCETCQTHKCVTCNFTKKSRWPVQPLKERCFNCSVGYGITPEGKCEHCGEFCSRCDHAGACSVCQHRFTLDNASLRAGAGKCQACGDWCMSCNTAGPGHCDDCMQGFQVDKTSRTC